MKVLLIIILYIFIALRISFPNAFEFGTELLFKKENLGIDTRHAKLGLQILLKSEDKTYIHDSTINEMVYGLETGKSIEELESNLNESDINVKQLFVEYCLKKRKDTLINK